MKYLSIIIPSYNSEKFIIKCLDSFSKDVLDDIEIIVVNDGSKDNTSSLVKEYTKSHPYIQIIDKENGGHGSVFNEGIKVVKGLYTKILDSDDYLDQDALKHLLDVMKKHYKENTLPDVYLADYYACPEGSNSRILISLSKNASEVESFISWKDITHLSAADFLMVHMTYLKTSFIKEHNIHLLEKVFYEDSELVFKVIKYAESLYFVNKPIYLYSVGREGQSISIDSIDKNYAHQFKVMEQILKSITYDEFKAMDKGKQKHIKHELYLLYTLTYFYAFIRPTKEKTLLYKKGLKEFKENNYLMYKVVRYHTPCFFLYITPPFLRRAFAQMGYTYAKRKEGWK